MSERKRRSRRGRRRRRRKKVNEAMNDDDQQRKRIIISWSIRFWEKTEKKKNKKQHVEEYENKERGKKNIRWKSGFIYSTFREQLNIFWLFLGGFPA